MRRDIAAVRADLQQLGLWQDYEFADRLKGQTGPVILVTDKNKRGLGFIIANEFEGFFDLVAKATGKRPLPADARRTLNRLKSGLVGHNWCGLTPEERAAFVFRRKPTYKKNAKYGAYAAQWQTSWKLLGAEKHIDEFFEAEFLEGGFWQGGRGKAWIVARLDDEQTVDFRDQVADLVTDVVFWPDTECSIDESAPGGGVCYFGEYVFQRHNTESYGWRTPLLVVSNPKTGSMWQQSGLKEMSEDGYNSADKTAVRVK